MASTTSMPGQRSHSLVPCVRIADIGARAAVALRSSAILMTEQKRQHRVQCPSTRLISASWCAQYTLVGVAVAAMASFNIAINLVPSTSKPRKYHSHHIHHGSITAGTDVVETQNDSDHHKQLTCNADLRACSTADPRLHREAPSTSHQRLRFSLPCSSIPSATRLRSR